MPENKRYFGSGAELQDKVSFRHLSYKTLASIASGGAMALRMEIMAAGHPDVVAKSPLSDEEAEMIVRANAAKKVGQGSMKSHAQNDKLGRGKIVVHEPTGKKVTIIRAAGNGKLEVIDKNGKKFTANESNLRPR